MKKHTGMIAFFVLLIFSCGGGGGGGSDSGPTAYWNKIDWHTADGGAYSTFTYDGLSPSCSNKPGTLSSEFNFFVRNGSENKLVVYFQGGGACWHVNNCITEPTYSFELQYFETEDILDLISNGQGRSQGYSGIFDFTSSANPFRDWSFVYIPYCTGDLHWGAEDTTYGSDVIRHRGQVNFQLVLQWLVDHYATAPDKILVTGISGGAYGAIFNFPHIRDAFPTSDAYMLGDAGNGVVTADFRTAGLPNWDVHLPETATFTDFNGVDPTTLDLPEIYYTIANHYAGTPFAQYTAAWDENQAYFYNVMVNITTPGVGGAIWDDITAVWCDWHDLMLTNRDNTIGGMTTGNYQYFIAPGDVHTILFSNEFYTATSNGTLFIDWVKAMIDGTAGFVDVLCTGDCGKPAECPACP